MFWHYYPRLVNATFSAHYIIHCYILLNLKCTMEYSRSVYVYVFIYYIFIVWIYLCFHGCSCWCWRWWSSDSFWYQSSVYLLYIKVYIYIYTNLYLHHILVYIFFSVFFESNQIWIFLNPIQKWPGVGLNIELAGFCAFLPYLFGAIASLGVGKLADKLLEDGRVPWRFQVPVRLLKHISWKEWKAEKRLKSVVIVPENLWE